MWRRISFKVKQGARRRTKHLADMCGRFVREAVVEFNSKIEGNVIECLRILNILSENVKLEKLVLRPQSCQIAWPDRDVTNTIDLYVDALEGILRRSRGLKHLSLGCIGELTDYSASLVPMLADHHAKSLETLHVASIKEDPDMYGLIDLPSTVFANFRRLTALGIDYDYVTHELLEGFAQNNRAKLEQLIIHVHGIEPGRQNIPNSVWQCLVTYNPTLEVTVNLIHSIDGATGLLNILRPALPLAHLRMFFCQHINVAAVNFISQCCSTSLKSVHIIDGMVGHQTNTYEVDTDEDPFVMMAWKCPKLSSFTLIGYEICSDDVVAIARLRGSNLKNFAIPHCCISTIEDDNENNVWMAFGQVGEAYNSEISRNLSRDWEPLKECELHPAVTNPHADAETAYLDLLLQDQAY